jgi:hypothetical protein
MASEQRQKKVFNFGESPLVRQTEQMVVEGYQAIESEEQGGRTNPNAQPPQQEDTKGIQAYIPMSLYERLVMRKLKTKEPLGSMFVQALRLWADVQEGKLSVKSEI